VSLGSPWGIDAQTQSMTARLTRVTGRVEVLPNGQTGWLPATVGGQLRERDEIRAFAGGSAVLVLADASTLILAENSRMVVTRLEGDPGGQTRHALFHLVVGKVRAIVTHAALALVQTRQSTFAITTPTAVAAARGTDYVTVFNLARQSTTVVVLEEGRNPAVPAASPPTGRLTPGSDEDVYVVRLPAAQPALEATE
jgi:hypothetical protein